MTDGSWIERGKRIVAACVGPLTDRPTSLPEGSWLGDFGPLSEAEEDLVEKSRIGKCCDRGSAVPDSPTAENTIRAGIIRFLVLGGDARHPVHDLGVWLQGAWVRDDLDLECVQSSVFLALEKCRIEQLMRATDAALPGLRLDGTKLQKLDAERLNIGGSLFFRGAIAVQEEVRLDGAKVGGNLDCDGGLFGAPLARSDADRPERIEVALSAEGIIVRGDVLLGNGFCARGGVRLTGARIKGNLTCSQGCFDAVCAQDQIRDPDDPVVALSADRMLVKGNVFFNEGFEARGGVRLVGAHIEGSLDCSGSKFTGPEGCEVIDAQRMVVDGRFEADESTFEGLANLSAAKVGSLADSPKSWRDNSLRLDGFHYDRISESADAVARIAWLRKQIDEHVKADFRPQPWEQLITAMRAMGHPGEASKIAIAKEKARGKSAQMRPIWRGPQKLKKLAKWQEWARTVHRSIHWFFGAFARFGYSPLRTFFWISFLWALCSFYFADARDNGLFGPTAPAIQLSEALQSCGGPGKIFWTSVECKLPAEYTAFDPWLYSLDLILPFVDLQQESNWAPITSTDAGRALSSGWALRWLMWIEIIFGWLMSLLLLTALGRLLNRD